MFSLTRILQILTELLYKFVFLVRLGLGISVVTRVLFINQMPIIQTVHIDEQ